MRHGGWGPAARAPEAPRATARTRGENVRTPGAGVLMLETGACRETVPLIPEESGEQNCLLHVARDLPVVD